MADSTKILIVEDEKLVRNEIDEKLQAEGYRTVLAANGLEGLKLFEEERPDLCLVDVLLPKMNGFDLCAAIKGRQEGDKIPVFLMSAVYKSLAVQNEAKAKYGADEFLTKPIKHDMLLRKIAAVLPKISAPAPRPDTLPMSLEEVADSIELDGEVDIDLDLQEPDAVEEPPAPSIPAPEKGFGGDLDESFSFEDDEEPEQQKFSYEGDLAKTPFPELLMRLVREEKTASVYFKRGKVEKTLYLQRGCPVSISSNLLSEVLGRILLKIGRISEEKYKETFKVAKRLNRLHGSVILETGLITEEQLADALKLQQEEKFLNLFSWATGEFHVAEEEPSDIDGGYSLDLPPLLMRGVRERCPAGLVRQILGPRHTLIPVPLDDGPYPFWRFGLVDTEIELLKMLDGRTDLKTWAKGTGRLDDALKIFYALLLAGAMDLKTPEESPPPEESARILAEYLEKPATETPGDYEFDVPSPEPVAEETAEAEAGPEAPAEDEGPEAGAPTGEAFPEEAPAPTEEAAPEEAPAPTEEAAPEEAPAPEETPAAEEEDRDDETAPIEEQIERWSRRIEGEDYFALLGVSRDAAEKEIHQAYVALARRFHPQKVGGGLDEERRRELDRIFQALATAHEVLMDEDDRAEHLESLERS